MKKKLFLALVLAGLLIYLAPDWARGVIQDMPAMVSEGSDTLTDTMKGE